MKVWCFMKKRKAIACLCAAFVVCSSAFVIGAAYSADEKTESKPAITESALEREVFKPVTEQEKVIYDFVSNPGKSVSLSDQHQINNGCELAVLPDDAVNSVTVYDISKGDQIYLSQAYWYDGKIYEKISYDVEYDIQYDQKYQHMMPESSGIKTKHITLLLTDEGWLVNEMGY